MFKTTNFPATWNKLVHTWCVKGEPNKFNLTNNTHVIVDTSQDEDHPTFTVFLHDKKIATLELGVITYTMAGWPTATTKQRVNRILGDNRIQSVRTRQGVTFGHHGEPIGDYEEVKVYHDVE